MVVGRGSELRQRPDAVRQADVLRAVRRLGRRRYPVTRCASAAWTSARSSRWRSTATGSRSASRSATTASAPTAGCPSAPTPSSASVSWRSTRAAASRWRSAATLPLEQSTTPYQLYDAFSDLTTNTAGWDLECGQAFAERADSETLDPASRSSRPRCDGVARFSDTIGKRDEEFKDLLARPTRSPRVLGNRSEQINRLLVNAQVLLAAVNERSQAVDVLLQNVSAVSQQFAGFVNDNPNLTHVLDPVADHQRRAGQAQRGSRLLDHHGVEVHGRAGRGHRFRPVLQDLLVNIVPYQILQPWVDAAFKKRGIDPEEFWRNAGLPAFRFPDPNGTDPGQRRPAAGAAGARGHPGVPRARPSGRARRAPTPPPAGGSPTPGNPLPCAGLDPGSVRPGARVGSAPPDVRCPRRTRPAAAQPRRARRGHPGTPGPLVPGAPGPALAPGPPGARTVPVRPRCRDSAAARDRADSIREGH